MKKKWTVLAIMVALNSLYAIKAKATNGFFLEFYPNLSITGSNGLVTDLTSNANYPDNPSSEQIIEGPFRAPNNIGDRYGQRARAYLTPTSSGTYYFYLSSDNAGELYLSTNDNPANKTKIAYVEVYTAENEWTKYAIQKSAAISLTAGRRYYIEALMVEETGGDNLMVGWTTNSNNSNITVLPQACLTPYQDPPVITTQPVASQVYPQNVGTGSATFTIGVKRPTFCSYQWLDAAGNEIAGATDASYTVAVTAENIGAEFRCRVTNYGGTVTSQSAAITVIPDTTPPTLESFSLGESADTLYLTFSEPLAENLTVSDFSLSGYTVTGIALANGGRTAALTLNPAPSSGVTITLGYTVSDRASPANTATVSGKTITLPAPAAIPDRIRYGAVESPGPSSRRTAIAITEIQAAPATRNDGKDLRFVEIYNSNPFPESIGGYTLSGSIEYTFPAGYRIPANGYVVVAASPADIAEVYGISNVVAADSADNFSLPFAITFNDELKAWLSTIKVEDADPWPAGINGTGHSLVLARPSYGDGTPDGWARSAYIGGSPGKTDPARPTDFSGLLINEILPASQDDGGFIELLNAAASAKNLAQCTLERRNGSFTFPAGNTVSAKAKKVFDAAQLGFSANGAGDELLLRAPNGAGAYIIDAVRLPATEAGRSYGRYPDGGPLMSRLESVTPATANAKRAATPVVLNELMYNPITEDKNDEYIELLNLTGEDITLAGWTLSGGIDYEFTETIAANGYFVVPSKKANFRALYPGATDMMAQDSYSGSLGNSRDTVRLSQPLQVWDCDANEMTTMQVAMEEVTYRDGGEWGKWADGGGSSLERVDPRADPRLPSSWGDSDETKTCDWTTISYTGTLELGRTDDSNGTPDEVQIGLFAAGECLIDSVVLKQETGSNLVQNESFENGTSYWAWYGTHDQTTIESNPDSDNGSHVMHLRAVARLHTGGNGVRGTLKSSVGTSGRATISMRARWLKGCPQIMMRARGNWIEAFGDLTTTKAFGTPGARNSRALDNIGPSITSVTHYPLLPTNGEAVTIFARIDDPDGIMGAAVRWHKDESAVTNTAMMAACGGGWYSATIPAGQTSGALVGFQIDAIDAADPAATATFPADTSRECLYRYGEPRTSNTLGVYHFWITQNKIREWAARKLDSNSPVDMAFVYNNDRVVYFAGAQFGGSPFHSTGVGKNPINNGNSIDYKIDFPKDDMVLDDDGMVLPTVGNKGNDVTAVKEQLAYAWVRRLGLPNVHRRFIHIYANGTQQNSYRVYEDTEKPNSSFLRHWFKEGSDGDLFKLDDWFEYAHDLNSFTYRIGGVEIGATLQSFKTFNNDGVLEHKLPRYRWNWLKRACSNWQYNDYTNFWGLVDVMNLPNNEIDAAIAETVNVKAFTGAIAVNQFIGNYDSYGTRRGKNMYLYGGDGYLWTLLAWDMDISFTQDTSLTLTQPINPLDSGFPNHDPVIWAFLKRPWITREFWRQVIKIAKGAASDSIEMQEAVERNAALRADGCNLNTFTAVADKIATRTASVNSQIAALNAPRFALTSPVGNPVEVETSVFNVAGVAPFEVTDITVDGKPLTVTWTNPTNWIASVTMHGRNHTFVFEALAEDGTSLGTESLSVKYTGSSISSGDRFLVINEIMNRPETEGGGYVEIYNTSSSNTLELTGFYLDGNIKFTFPDGWMLGPASCAVVAEDSTVFQSLYGGIRALAGAGSGTLGESGIVRLRRPATGMELDDPILDAVNYGAPGWQSETDAGIPYQRIDPLGGSCQPANWCISKTASHSVSGHTILPLNTSWSYYNSGYPGTGWQLDSFDFSGWESGPAPLGKDSDASGWQTPLATTFNITSGRCTYYFKTSFNYYNLSKNAGDNIFPNSPSQDLISHGYLVHRWSFNGNLTDSVTGGSATLKGSSSLNNAGTGVYCRGGNRGTSWVDLGSNVLPADNSPVTIEVWYTPHSVQTWSRVFDFGGSTISYLTLGYNNNTSTGFYALNNDNKTDFGTLDVNTYYHLAMVLVPDSSGTTATVYKMDANGRLLGYQTSYHNGWLPSTLQQTNCWLAHSQFSGDKDANSTFDEVRIWNAALSMNQLVRNSQLGPDRPPALGSSSYSEDELFISYLIDDCAVVYLNGQEVHRTDRTPDGEIFDTTLATTYTPQELEGTLFGPFSIDNSALREGINYLSVEVHQNAATSSDIAWALILSASNHVSSALSPGAPNRLVDTPETLPSVVINEIANEDGSVWAELYNAGSDTADLGGWRLSAVFGDGTSVDHDFPAGTELAASGFTAVRFESGAGEGTLLLLASENDGERRCADSTVFDRLDRGAYGCYPDGDTVHRRTTRPATFAAANRIDHPEQRVVINEFMAQNELFVNPLTGDYDDWFELYNDGNESVDLSGWIVTDTLISDDPPVPNTKASKALTIPAGVTIAPGEALRVWTGASGSSSLPFDRDNLQAPFGLNKSSDQICLFDPEQNIADRIQYNTLQSATESNGRWPNGSGEWRTMPVPTPGDPNRPSRFTEPAGLAAMGSVTVCEGDAFSATNAVEGLSYTLVAAEGETLPEGLSVDAATGVISWTPSATQTPGVYRVLLCGVLDGECVDAVQVTFVATPAGAIVITSCEYGPHGLTLRWPGTSGVVYRVEWCSDLTAPQWQELPDRVSASNGEAEVTVDTAELPNRIFLRVKR